MVAISILEIKKEESRIQVSGFGDKLTLFAFLGG